MSTLDLARLQFASTSIYHFLFVPVTIGLSVLVAGLHTAWYRTGKSEYRRLTKFFGTLMLINIAIGVVTGLVQEFQFGMNWSTYSRVVGDVFGAPLAMEGLMAFFLESTFLGLWVFGWNVLPKRVHMLTAWAVAAGTMLSAAFIMAANSWMQRPVGYKLDPATGHAQLSSISAVMTNPVFLWSYAHVLLASVLTAAMVMLAVSAWQLRKGSNQDVFLKSAKLSLAILLPVSFLILLVGSELGVQEATYQPMKIAAAEAQWNTCDSNCPFSIFQIGGGSNDHTPTQIIQVPGLLSLLATGSIHGKVEGLTPLNEQAQAKYGPGNYVPNVFIQYWSMRVMAYLATLVFLLSLWGLFLWRRRTLATSRAFLWVSTWAVITPIIMNTAGWMLTENGRQPWIVQGLQLTKDGVSPSVSTLEVVISLVVFYLVYLALGVVDGYLMVRYSRRELAPSGAEGADEDVPPADEPRLPALTY